MHLNGKSVAVTAVLAALVFLPLSARAATVITNTGTANYTNEAAVAQAAVNGSTVFTVALNPVLTVVKTRDIGKGQSGQVVTFEIRVAYPRKADVLLLCGDDSDALTVNITDAVPAGMTYVANSIKISTNNGGAYGAAGTDASDGVDASGFDVSSVAGTVTAKLGTIIEGTGDAACTGVGTTRVVQFKVTVN